MTEMSGEKTFGSCCDELKEALGSDAFDPLITVGDDGVLYMSVGLVDVDDEDANIVEHPIFFCPFCGTGLQTPDEVKDRVGAAPAGDS